MADFTTTGIWQDVEELPATLRATLDGADGFADVAERLRHRSVRRIVMTGNGASYYVAHAIWLASLAGRPRDVELLAIPGGLVARGAFPWREGDALLALSSSGEFRDVIEAIENGGGPRPFALLTAEPTSTLATASDVQARVVVSNQRALTHTQAFCGAVLSGLDILARITEDDELAEQVAAAPELAAEAVATARGWHQELAASTFQPVAAVAFGTGPAWAAALEAALLIKEIADIPCEGVETREAATSAMTGLGPENLALSLPTHPDALIDEAERLIRARGTRVLRAPTDVGADPRLAAITTFPAALVFAVELALRTGHDPDAPSWRDNYYATARQSIPST
jgi:fructoselysine-6-P-deglycase FrlB-like protein